MGKMLIGRKTAFSAKNFPRWLGRYKSICRPKNYPFFTESLIAGREVSHGAMEDRGAPTANLKVCLTGKIFLCRRRGDADALRLKHGAECRDVFAGRLQEMILNDARFSIVERTDA
jgi:hypothetical protein